VEEGAQRCRRHENRRRVRATAGVGTIGRFRRASRRGVARRWGWRRVVTESELARELFVPRHLRPWLGIFVERRWGLRARRGCQARPTSGVKRADSSLHEIPVAKRHCNRFLHGAPAEVRRTDADLCAICWASKRWHSEGGGGQACGRLQR